MEGLPGNQPTVLDHSKPCQSVTTNITTTMDSLFVLISLCIHYAYAASQDQRRRFVKRQQDSSSSPKPTQTSTSTPPPSSGNSLPTSIQTRIPIPPSLPPDGTVQTTIPEHPGPSSDKGPIIGFSIGVVVLAILFMATGWMLFRRYKMRRQQQAASQNLVQLQPTNHYASSITKRSLDDTDTQSAASHK